MDPSQLLREARRHAGYSQRHLAAVSGLSLRTVVDVEQGRRRVSAAALDALVGACGLDLTLCLRSADTVPAAVLDHLRLPTTVRLRLHCGGTGDALREGPPLWQELVEVARHAVFVLVDGPDAVGVWSPGLPVLTRASVGVLALSSTLPLPATPLLDVSALPPRAAPHRRTHGVHIGIPGGGYVVVPPPSELLLDARCADHDVALRTAARALHVQAARDDGGRRAPAHRDPDEQQEGANLSRSLTYAMDSRRLPESTDSRGWRLGAPVSLRQWHEENGHPPRRGSRRER